MLKHLLYSNSPVSSFRDVPKRRRLKATLTDIIGSYLDVCNFGAPMRRASISEQRKCLWPGTQSRAMNLSVRG
jgi:hypothetical protein